MSGIIRRLRAAVSPQALALIAAAMLLFLLAFRTQGTQERQTALEERAASVLSQMEGAGKVSVVVMTKPASQASGTRWSALSGASGTDGVVPCGAVAVAQGADDPLVQMQLTQALCALLGLPASAVSVVTGGK